MRYFNIFFTFLNVIRKYGKARAIKMAWEYLVWKVKGFLPFGEKEMPMKYQSFRNLVKKNFFPAIPTDDPAMEPLRKGR